MYFKIVAENVTTRIFDFAQSEGAHRRTILRTVKHIGNKLIIHCRCESINELARVITTLETDKDALVSLVENSFGSYIPFKGGVLETRSYDHAYSFNTAF